VQTNFNADAFRRSLAGWFSSAARALPWRNTRDPYAILVSEMMLQQTQVATVLSYFERWMNRFPDLAALAGAQEREVLLEWQGLGYYSRARNLHRAAQAIMEIHGGVFPRELDTIRSLPGLGRYTAGAVATFAFDLSTPIVDANIARVLARVFEIRLPIDSTAGSRAIWNAANFLQPARNAGRFNASLMELGALICVARTPLCLKCPVRAQCGVRDPSSLPIKKPPPPAINLFESAGFVCCNGKVLLMQETGNRWRGLWRFPPIKHPFHSEKRESLTRLRYPITRYRVTLEIVKATEGEIMGELLSWFSKKELENLPMPSPHRRALAAVLTGRSLAGHDHPQNEVHNDAWKCGAEDGDQHIGEAHNSRIPSQPLRYPATNTRDHSIP
jgi:A/G-specific adenine glycosylase